MISHASKILHSLVFVIMAFSFLACGLTVQTSNAAKTPMPSPSIMVETATAAIPSGVNPMDVLPSPIPTFGLTATPALPMVTITAINGNIYIRRGSGSDFDPTGVLLQGETATATGRDILNEWLYIPIPSQAGKFGWVSTLTVYSSVSGNTMDLPVVDSDLAVPAFIQNCSTDDMIVQPTSVILPPWYQYPNNIVQFDPGEYTIMDYDNVKYNPKSNQGIVVDLREGELLKFTAMGTNAQHKCPIGQ